MAACNGVILRQSVGQARLIDAGQQEVYIMGIAVEEIEKDIVTGKLDTLKFTKRLIEAGVSPKPKTKTGWIVTVAGLVVALVKLL